MSELGGFLGGLLQGLAAMTYANTMHVARRHIGDDTLDVPHAARLELAGVAVQQVFSFFPENLREQLESTRQDLINSLVGEQSDKRPTLTLVE